MPAYNSRSDDKPRDHRPVFPPRDFREPLDHSDPRQRLSFKPTRRIGTETTSPFLFQCVHLFRTTF